MATKSKANTATPNTFEQLLDYGKGNGYKLDWLQQRETFGKELEIPSNGGGLLLQDVDSGPFAEVPAWTNNVTGRTRGALTRPSAARIGKYGIRTKADVWLKNGAQLYEEAVQRQWSSATDIPWHELEELPDEIEQAECQLATFLTEVEFVAGDVPGRWISETSPDYYEPRMFLISQIMDEARHADVFRKRALANGGGLLQQNSSAALAGASIDSARDFTEMSARLHISGEGLVLSIFRMGERMAYNNAEKAIYRLAASDESRHVAFGVMHLQYVSQTDPERSEEIHSYLDEIELGLVAGTGGQNPAVRGTPSNAAIMTLLGGGTDEASLREGEQIAGAVRQRQVKEYIQRIKVAGFGDRFTNGRAAAGLTEYISA
ncbi:MAG TPA: ferritin-like domain-containing protein [Dehalococcoidia bacterium]|nr:ferritin-like domain-containing protein [Dehalococcoidia bacterium]